jgi:hypothetical protein
MRKKSDEQSDARKSPVGREFESCFFGGDCVIANVTRLKPWRRKLMVITPLNWTTIEYPGIAAFCIPPHATHELIDDDCTIRVTHESTDLLAGLFPLRQSTTASVESLELELRDFTDRCVRPHVDVTRESYGPAADVDFAGIACIQSVLTIGSDRIWIARAYARIGGDALLLVQWNGPIELAQSFPVPLFVSLVPLFAVAGGG